MRRLIGALALTTLAGGSALAATDEEVQRLLERQVALFEPFDQCLEFRERLLERRCRRCVF